MFPIINQSSRSRFALLFLLAIAVSACSSKAEQAQSYYEHGEKLLAENNSQGAALEFKNAIRLKNDFLPAYRSLAKIDEADHNWSELVATLRRIVELDPKDVDAKLKLARLMLYGNATAQAQKLINEIDAPDNANVLALRAAISYKLKDVGNALSDAQAAIKIDPANVDAMMILAADRLQKNDAQGALQILDANPDATEKNLGVQLFKIRIFEQLKDLPKIEAQLQKLVSLYPQEPAFRKQLVKFYIDQHRLDDAESQLRAIVAADPKNPTAVLDLVRFLYATKGPTAARDELVNHINAGGDVFTYQMALAEFDYSQGHDDDSFKLLETLAGKTDSADHALAAKIKLAEFNLGRKKIGAAEAVITDVLHSDSRNTSALKLRAIIEMDRNQLESATNDLRTALNDQPRSTELMLLLASAYERSGSTELAEKQYADAMRASNFDTNAALSYVAFLRRHGNLQRAEDVLSDLASRQPNNISILSTMAEVRLARQDYAGAQEVGDTIKRIGGNNGIADQILGAAFSGEKKYDQSIAAFQSAVTEAPSAVQPMVALVRSYLQANQPDKAISFLQSELKTHPENAEAFVLLGSVQIATNAPDQAIKSFNSAIEKQPKNIIGYRALADLYVNQKNTDAALTTIQAGLKQQPDNVVLHMSLAGLMELNKNYEGAISAYEYVLGQQPGSLIAANNLASMLADHRTDKASLEQARKLAESLRKTPVPQFKDTIGWIDYRLGDFKSAVPLLEEAAAALPDLAVVRYHLGMSYMAAGQTGKAADEFTAALTKNPSNELADIIKAELKKTASQ